MYTLTRFILKTAWNFQVSKMVNIACTVCYKLIQENVWPGDMFKRGQHEPDTKKSFQAIL